ncbi:PrsW family glutamic-type intramembrane protease [Anabaena sp. UHCC 0204]|uniref:PrsW family intramembrane metalloprotease n=2 Tax=unclassified Anabaena TaxID=2619674 RepID=UPI001444A57D|nr:PrsW family intramembrane metalloprotease [Anabaena sp. UHCC 0204]
MANLSLVLWAVIPPLMLLWFYYRRTPAAPPLLTLLGLFILGAIAGFVALGLEWGVETVANWVVNWQQMQRNFFVVILRQILVIAPIEEGCKLAAVVLAICYLQRQYYLRATTIFLFTIAAALGFTAEETWIYLFHGTASILERTIGTPVHAIFSAPWGYALGIYISSSIRFNRDRNLFFTAWLNSVFAHALVNVLSHAGRFPPPIYFLIYGLFPFLLWMFWRLEQLLRELQGKRPICLISGYTSQTRYYQRVLVLLIPLLSGNAILGLFLLSRKLMPLRWEILLEQATSWFIIKQILFYLFLGLLAWLIYRYLRTLARRRYLFQENF